MNAADHSSHGAAAPSVASPTLRETLDRRARQGQILPLEAAVAQLIPLCIEVAELNAQGYGCYLHPSNIVQVADGTLALLRERATQLASLPKDRACLPPETSPAQLNDARACVYSVGAILYEMVTGQSVGPGMARPTEVVPTLPNALESILTAALITEPAARPGALSELANSLHVLCRPGTVPPPNPSIPIPPTSGPIAIDVSLSLLPPTPAAQAPMLVANAALNPFGVTIQAAPSSAPPPSAARVAASEAATVAELKARLESDPRPRYFVVKQGMDHGPFTAVELAHHLLNHSFEETDSITDNVAGKTAPIKEYPQFVPFAEQAKRERSLRERKDAIGVVAAQEKKSTRSKALVGVAGLLVLIASGTLWYVTKRGERSDAVAVAEDQATSVETDGSIRGRKKSRRKRRSRDSSSAPIISGGKSCEAARDAYNEMMVVGQKGGQADITGGQYAAVLNSGAYFSHCGIPNSMEVNICAAVQNGSAVGVTVRVRPNNRRKQQCISKAVRRLRFPSHPKLDITRTHFAAQ